MPALFNTGTYTDSLATINYLAKARSIDSQLESVKMVKGKAKNSTKGPCLWKRDHCDKTGHKSEFCWKRLVTDEGRAGVEKKVSDTTNKGSDAKSKRPETANKAIDLDLNYLDPSVAWLSTANGKIDGNWYLDSYAIYHTIRSWTSRSGRASYSGEPHEEDKIVCDVAAVGCETEPVSDPYGQIRGRHLTVEERIPEGFIAVEDERSHDVRTYSRVGGFKLYSRFDPDDQSTTLSNFIQASSAALLPNEASPTPLLEVVSPTFLKPNFWICETNLVLWSLLRGRSMSLCGNV